MVSSPDRVRDKDGAKESPNYSATLLRPSGIPRKNGMIWLTRFVRLAERNTSQHNPWNPNEILMSWIVQPRGLVHLHVIGMKAKKYARMTKISVYLPQSMTRSTIPPSPLVEVIFWTPLRADPVPEHAMHNLRAISLYSNRYNCRNATYDTRVAIKMPRPPTRVRCPALLKEFSRLGTNSNSVPRQWRYFISHSALPFHLTDGRDRSSRGVFPRPHFGDAWCNVEKYVRGVQGVYQNLLFYLQSLCMECTAFQKMTPNNLFPGQCMTVKLDHINLFEGRIRIMLDNVRGFDSILTARSHSIEKGNYKIIPESFFLTLNSLLRCFSQIWGVSA